MTQSLVPKDNTSPFESSRHIKDGYDYWSAESYRRS